MTTREKLSTYLAEVRPHGKGRQLIVEAKAEIEKFRTHSAESAAIITGLRYELSEAHAKNALMKAALLQIKEEALDTSKEIYGRAYKSAAIAQEALSE